MTGDPREYLWKSVAQPLGSPCPYLTGLTGSPAVSLKSYTVCSNPEQSSFYKLPHSQLPKHPPSHWMQQRKQLMLTQRSQRSLRCPDVHTVKVSSGQLTAHRSNSGICQSQAKSVKSHSLSPPLSFLTFASIEVACSRWQSYSSQPSSDFR